MRRHLAGPVAVAATLAAVGTFGIGSPRTASAGGFDIPDQGTESLGRGGAFVAKSDSPLALYYNVASLAKMRGTRLLVDVNLVFHNMTFKRAGTYAGDPTDPRTPWAGQEYPEVGNNNTFAYQPFLAATTDFGYFKKWGFGIGLFTPPGIGSRSYGTRRDAQVMNGNNEVKEGPRWEVDLPSNTVGTGWDNPDPMRAPSPVRYDVVESTTQFLMPTAGVGFQPIKYLDLGFAMSWVVGSAEIYRNTLSPLGADTCGKSGESPNCDAYSFVRATLQTYGMIASVGLHPTNWLDIGITYRPQINLKANGKSFPQASLLNGVQVPAFPISLGITLPHILRWGIRAVAHYADGSERADLELGGTYENWKAQDWTRSRSCNYSNPTGVPIEEGDTDCAYDPANPTRIKLVVNSPGQFKDTVSIRLGGAYNFRISDLTKVTWRAGAYFDSSTVGFEYTSVGSYGMAKYGLTTGLGIKYKGFIFDMAYAYVYMPDRNVTNSKLQAVSTNNGTLYQPSDLTVIVGNGLYRARFQTVSLGMTFNFDDFGAPAASKPAEAESAPTASN